MDDPVGPLGRSIMQAFTRLSTKKIDVIFKNTPPGPKRETIKLNVVGG